MNGNGVPTVGVALSLERFRGYRDWVLSGQRDLELSDPAKSNLLDQDWKPVVREAKELLDGYSGRLGIHGPFRDLTIAATDLRVRSLVTERLLQGLEFAACIGATHMVIHSHFRFNGASPFVPHSEKYGFCQDLDAVRATLDPVLPRAEEAGCVLVVENTLDRNPSRLISLVRSFASEFLQLSLDVGHAFRERQLGGAPPDQWVRDAGSLLAHLHLQDTDGDADRHWPPGTGSVQWYALFDALSELEHSPRLLIETKHDPVEGAEWLSSHGFVT